MQTTSRNRRYLSRAWDQVRGISDQEFGADFARDLRESARPLQVAYQRLMSAHDGCPTGIECRHADRHSWAFALLDVSAGQSWRVQQFDLDGFIGHLCFDTVEEAVEEMLRMGYQVVDAGALDRVASTSRWLTGVKRSTIMQRHQYGLISYRQMLDELSAVPKPVLATIESNSLPF